MPLAVTFPTPAYPFSAGYCDIQGVQDQVNAATWNAASANAYPPLATVNRWIGHVTGLIDVALAARGYKIPLTARTGYVVPSGQPALNGMAAQLYLHLEKIAIAYVVAHLEGSRHGSTGVNSDPEARLWMQEFDDYITRIETGADNLTQWGADGPFPPELDPSGGVDSGNLGMQLAGTDHRPDPAQEGPTFYKNLSEQW